MTAQTITAASSHPSTSGLPWSQRPGEAAPFASTAADTRKGNATT
jgi:hypothetical protein